MKISPHNRILAIARKHRIISPRDVEAIGVPPEYLLRLMRQGVILLSLTDEDPHGYGITAQICANGGILRQLSYHRHSDSAA